MKKKKPKKFQGSIGTFPKEKKELRGGGKQKIQITKILDPLAKAGKKTYKGSCKKIRGSKGSPHWGLFLRPVGKVYTLDFDCLLHRVHKGGGTLHIDTHPATLSMREETIKGGWGGSNHSNGHFQTENVQRRRTGHKCICPQRQRGDSRQFTPSRPRKKEDMVRGDGEFRTGKI